MSLNIMILLLLSAAIIAQGIYAHMSIRKCQRDIRKLEILQDAGKAKEMSMESLINAVQIRWGQAEQQIYLNELLWRVAHGEKSETSESRSAAEESAKDNQ